MKIILTKDRQSKDDEYAIYFIDDRTSVKGTTFVGISMLFCLIIAIANKCSHYNQGQ